MDIVIDTDISRDPDDFFAICYLASAGANIRAIVISPGDSDQVQVANFLRKELKIDAPIGVTKPRRTGFKSSNKFHMDILKMYGYSEITYPDGDGSEIMMEAFGKYPNAELFVIGPPTNTRQFFEAKGAITKCTMQGGFVSYDIHERQVERLVKFEGLKTCPTFNLNGDLRGTKALLEAFGVRRRFVGKNVCHTIYYDKFVHQECLRCHPRTHGSKLLQVCMGEYLKRHEGKLFHDPTAAVCLMHPEIGTWLTGKLYHEAGGWGTILSEKGDQMLIDIDRKALWKYIFTGR